MLLPETHINFCCTPSAEQLVRRQPTVKGAVLANGPVSPPLSTIVEDPRKALGFSFESHV